MERSLKNSDRDYWEKLAVNYDAKTRFLGQPVSRMLALIREWTAASNKILEVAAGTGLITSVLPSRAHVTATDYADAMVSQLRTKMQAEGRSNVICERADIYQLPYADESFDSVVAANVLHLIPDLPHALSELRRVLTPGGRLLAPTYCHKQTATSWLVSQIMALTSFPGHRRFSVESLQSTLADEGLHVDAQECIPGLIPIGFVTGTFRSE